MTDLTERLRKLLADATPGPWHISHAGATIRADKLLPAGQVSTRIAFGYDGTAEARAIDFRLITELRNNADDLLTTLETLAQKNARLREALEGIVTGDVERVVAHVWRADGKPSKLDQCAHDVQINHDCPSCIEDHARKALGGGDEQ